MFSLSFVFPLRLRLRLNVTYTIMFKVSSRDIICFVSIFLHRFVLSLNHDQAITDTI